MSTVAEQIDAQAPNAFVRLAMRLGATLEGGSLGAGPFPTGDQGTSPGPFQIHLPAHPGVTYTEAQDPAFAVHFMLPSYTSAAAQIPAGLWQSNPELAAEETAFHAERPAQDYYVARGKATVDNAWRVASGAAAPAGLGKGGGAGATTTAASTDSSSSGPCQGPSGFGVINPSSWVVYFWCKAEQDAKPALFEGAAVLAGATLVVLGLWRSVSRTQTYKAVKSSAGNAATIGAMA